MNAFVLAQHLAIEIHNLTRLGGDVLVEEGLHGTMGLNQAQVLAFRLVGHMQPKLASKLPGLGLVIFPQGKEHRAQHILIQVVEEIGLILVAIERPQQLIAPLIRVVVRAGIVTGGNAIGSQLLAGIAQHGAKLHRLVALGTGERRGTALVAIHQIIDDVAFKGVANIHHVVGNAQFFAELGRVHHAFRAALALAAHQPKGDTQDFKPLLFQQHGRG